MYIWYINFSTYKTWKILRSGQEILGVFQLIIGQMSYICVYNLMEKTMSGMQRKREDNPEGRARRQLGQW